MQGITDARYRRQHYTTYGGVAEYYTPFARVERGRIRDKEKKDLLPERNQGVPTVPQVIARDRSEFATLCDSLQRMGWGRIDINMGAHFRCRPPLAGEAAYCPMWSESRAYCKRWRCAQMWRSLSRCAWGGTTRCNASRYCP